MGLALDDHDLWVHDESLTGQQSSTCHITEKDGCVGSIYHAASGFFLRSGTLTS